MKPSRLALSIIGLTLAVAVPLTVSIAASTFGRDNDQYFVILSTSKDRSAAMLKGEGWVLETSLYSKLGEGWYANVQGPFKSATEAKKRLADLKGIDKSYSKAYVKNAGKLQLPMSAAWNTSDMPPALVAAFIGSLDLKVERHQGASNGCEPQEPYYTIMAKQIKGEPSYDPNTDRVGAKYSFESALVGKGLTMDEKTGEISEMHICLE
jgi:hypothetical protein